MLGKRRMTVFLVIVICSTAAAADVAAWWNPDWRFRTTVSRATPYRDDSPRPVEVAVDFPLLLDRAGIRGEFDPVSLRVVERSVGGPGREVPFAHRTERNAQEGRDQTYLTWIAQPKIGQVGAFDVYFGTKDRGTALPAYDPDLLPPENLLVNAGFERAADSNANRPDAWSVTPAQLVHLGKFAHTTGERSLEVVVDEETPSDTERNVTISQKVDVRKYAGQEMVFECDLLAERAAYGAPVSIVLQQFRADGSRIPEAAVQPRWLTIELAQGQLVQLRQRGRFNPDAATVDVRVRMRCYVRDADTREIVTGPESFFTVWLDRMVLRPGERWPWPAASHAGFVEGALESAPLNRAFECTGQRRIVFNGASEGTLTSGRLNPDPRSVHWGLEVGTLEFWCRPSWNVGDGVEHLFFEGIAYGHRLQSRLRKRGADGGNQLEFSIADAGGTLRTVRGDAPLRAGQWHHIAAAWDFPKAHLQLFVDGKRIASQGPGADPWPSSLFHTAKGKDAGIGISEEDTRSMPMQAFIGGGQECSERRAAEAALDDFRISDVARYSAEFVPSRDEFKTDEHTRALFHFENERNGVHDADDRFVFGHEVCELEPWEQEAPLEILDDGKIERRMALVKPYPSQSLFEANRAENRLTVRRPLRELPDPRFVEYSEKRVERTVTGTDDDFVLEVEGDFQPLMRSVVFEHAKDTPAKTTLLPRWRANDNVVPFSVESLAATLAPDAATDTDRAFEVFKYSLQLTNYYDAHYCETLPSGLHRPRISYTLLKALNIYPTDQCGPLNYSLRKLFLTAGISSNDASGTHHQFEQAYYGGDWRLFDLSPRLYWLNRDNTTIASRRAFEDDLYLKIRQDSSINSGIRGRRTEPRFGVAERPHSMDFPLRPGERASICWHNEGRWFEVAENREVIPLAKIPPSYGNGAVVFDPTEGEAAELDNMVIERLAGGAAGLRAKDTARPASLIYRAQCPYIFSGATVSGAFQAAEPGAIRTSLSFDKGKTWSEVWRNTGKTGEVAADLTEHVTGRYAYWLKIDLSPGQGRTVNGLKVRTVFVASPLALPGKLSLGKNRISFVGARPTVPVKTTCTYVERRKSDLGVSLSSLSYYNMDDDQHRNLFITPPGGEVPVQVTLEGQPLSGEVALENLPEGWTSNPGKKPINLLDRNGSASERFAIQTNEGDEGEVHAFDVVVHDRDRPQTQDSELDTRRITAQVLIADAALVREAEKADESAGRVAPFELAELSDRHGMAFSGGGKLSFDFTASREGRHALWLLARWDRDGSTRMTLAVERKNGADSDVKTRNLRRAVMIGFTDWTDPNRAHTKMFNAYGEQYGHWAWYRIPDIQLGAGEHRLTLGAESGVSFDALVLLPQTPAVDRAAMNLFQNWNYAPWNNPK